MYVRAALCAVYVYVHHLSIWYRQSFFIRTHFLLYCHRLFYRCANRLTTLRDIHSHVRTRLPLVNLIYFPCTEYTKHTLIGCKLSVVVVTMDYEQCRLHVGTVWAIPCIDFSSIFHILKPVCSQTHTDMDLRFREKKKKKKENTISFEIDDLFVIDNKKKNCMDLLLYMFVFLDQLNSWSRFDVQFFILDAELGKTENKNKICYHFFGLILFIFIEIALEIKWKSMRFLRRLKV